MRDQPFPSTSYCARRALAAMLLGAGLARPEPRLGDDEWYRRFQAFLQELNRFVICLNDDRVDLAQWKKVCQAWTALGTRAGS